MKILATTLAILCAYGCQIYTGPPEYAPQCAAFEPVTELRISPASYPVERQAVIDAAATWRSAGLEVSAVMAASDESANVVFRAQNHPRLCYTAGAVTGDWDDEKRTIAREVQCEQAGQVQWVDGQPLIIIYRVEFDPYRTALHEIGHALAGNGCHPKDGRLMGEWAGPKKLSARDVEFVRRSQLTER